ncbi:MAG: hypothetical protein ACYDH6_19925 [Acidimicrobiales bacterium]
MSASDDDGVEERPFGPKGFLSLPLTEQQLACHQMAKQMWRWTDDDLAPKSFFGPVAHSEPIQMDRACDVVLHVLSQVVDPERAGSLWRPVTPKTRPPGSDSLMYFHSAHSWSQPNDITGGTRGTTYVEFVVEEFGTNESGWADELGVFGTMIPADWHVTHVTLAFVDTHGWVFPVSVGPAVGARAAIESALTQLYGAQPLIYRDAWTSQRG